MKKLAFLLCFLFLFGCSSVTHDTKLTNMPKLLEATALPTIPQQVKNAEFYVSVKMFVNEKGEVVKAQLLNGLGIPEWDSTAIKAIKKWKYEPARVDGTPVSLWLVQKVKVQVETPYYLTLAEIVCNNYEDAEFVYSKLIEGIEFYDLAAQYSVSQSKNVNGIIGKKDVNQYPLHISQALKNLTANQFTKPLPLGKQYVIFKRLATY